MSCKVTHCAGRVSAMYQLHYAGLLGDREGYLMHKMSHDCPYLHNR